MAIYMKFTGKVQGWVQGAVGAQKFANYIELKTVDFGEGSAISGSSGQVTGHRVARPMHITKPLDKSSPLLLQSSDTNEVAQVVIVYTQEGADHKSTMQIALTNAIIADFNHVAAADGTGIETLALSFQKLEFTWLDGGIVSSIDWTASSQ